MLYLFALGTHTSTSNIVQCALSLNETFTIGMKRSHFGVIVVVVSVCRNDFEIPPFNLTLSFSRLLSFSPSLFVANKRVGWGRQTRNKMYTLKIIYIILLVQSRKYLHNHNFFIVHFAVSLSDDGEFIGL